VDTKAKSHSLCKGRHTGHCPLFCYFCPLIRISLHFFSHPVHYSLPIKVWTFGQGSMSPLEERRSIYGI
jgi:hypothetical protein